MYWGLFFIYGYILYSDPRLLDHVRRGVKASVLWIILSAAALIAVALLTLLSIGQISNIDKVGSLPAPGIAALIYISLCLNSWAFMVLTACSSSREYRSKPTAAIWPLCSAPSRLPAPRISRSFIATAMPDPRSVFAAIVASRSCAVSVSGFSGG